MKHIPWHRCLLVTLLSAIMLMPLGLVHAQSFDHVVPFSTQSGRMGFFDQSDGTIYIYDSDLSKMLFKARLHELGDDIEHLERYDLPTSNKFTGKKQNTTVPNNK